MCRILPTCCMVICKNEYFTCWSTHWLPHKAWRWFLLEFADNQKHSSVGFYFVAISSFVSLAHIFPPHLCLSSSMKDVNLKLCLTVLDFVLDFVLNFVCYVVIDNLNYNFYLNNIYVVRIWKISFETLKNLSKMWNFLWDFFYSVFFLRNLKAIVVRFKKILYLGKLF